MRREGVLRAEFWVSATDHDRPVWVPACAGMTEVGGVIIAGGCRVWRVNLGETGGGDRNGMRRPVAASSSCRFVPAASGFAIPRDA